MNRLTYHSFKAKWGANAVYFRLPANAIGAEYAASLGPTASGANWGYKSKERLVARMADKTTFFATADAVLRK